MVECLVAHGIKEQTVSHEDLKELNAKLEPIEDSSARILSRAVKVTGKLKGRSFLCRPGSRASVPAGHLTVWSGFGAS